MNADTKHTPGPWQWVKRQAFGGRSIDLVHPHRGYLTVMDFVRLGMQGGTFRLATWKGEQRENMGGIMRPAHELDILNHPDAKLLAAAPLMFEALAAIVAPGSGAAMHAEVWALVREALKQAGHKGA